MTNSIVQKQQQTAQELARRYQSEGYEVIVEPMKDEIPDFLRYFHPDLIALRSDRSVAVEIKTSRRVRRADYWRELAEAVRAQPTWHLEIVSDGSPEPAEESISQEEIEEQVQHSVALAEAGELSASLLLASSALEAAMRLTAERFNVHASDPRPQSLANRLYSEGLMDREDYDSSLASLRQRDAVAHGFRQKVSVDELSRLDTIVRNLLTE